MNIDSKNGKVIVDGKEYKYDEAIKIIAALWEIISDDGVNVAAKVQEYRKQWRDSHEETKIVLNISEKDKKRDVIIGEDEDGEID